MILLYFWWVTFHQKSGSKFVKNNTSLDDKRDFLEYRLLDIIDGAIDMAMVDKKHVTVKISRKIKVHVNYRLYTTAIKI